MDLAFIICKLVLTHQTVLTLLFGSTANLGKAKDDFQKAKAKTIAPATAQAKAIAKFIATAKLTVFVQLQAAAIPNCEFK